MIAKPKAIIFDIDGTISDDSHRQPILNRNNPITPEDWEDYHSACIDDKPFGVVCEIMRDFFKSGHKIILITGRDEKYMAQTRLWFLEQELDFDLMIMRPNGNRDSSVKLKRDIYENDIKDNYQVEAVFEDRKRVVDMWRGLGLMCLQTKEGDY